MCDIARVRSVLGGATELFSAQAIVAGQGWLHLVPASFREAVLKRSQVLEVGAAGSGWSRFAPRKRKSGRSRLSGARDPQGARISVQPSDERKARICPELAER
jgi:hypothetical protein